MQWTDDAIVLAARRHGETSAIVTLLTRLSGKHAGLVRGAFGTRARGTWEIGNVVRATWRARLPEHLGTLTAEVERAPSAALLDDKRALLALASACALVDATLAEREPHERLHDSLIALLGRLGAPGWPESYVRFEVSLLAELGFGLDLSACAATGATADLAYVSPRSGRAVSATAGAPYGDRLHALPRFLVDPSAAAGNGDIRAGLELTGDFLQRHLFDPDRRPWPSVRQRLMEAFRQVPTKSGSG